MKNMHQNDTDRHGPGVKIPPPLMPLALILTGELLNRFIWRLSLPEFFDVLAYPLLAIAILISGTAFVQFVYFKTSIIPHKPDQFLMKSGIFALSRNPIYLSFLLLQAAVACFLSNAWLVVLLIPCYLFLRFYVIAREEFYLIGRYGDVYKDYLEKTRRWL
jgi:protein-S-isoprenylcysteine O-methyltransferase Ste14